MIKQLGIISCNIFEVGFFFNLVNCDYQNIFRMLQQPWKSANIRIVNKKNSDYYKVKSIHINLHLQKNHLLKNKPHYTPKGFIQDDFAIVKMEKDSKADEGPFLLFIYQLKQQRDQTLSYSYCIFAVEVFFVMMFPLNYSSQVADQPITTIIQFYRNTVLINPITIYLVHYLFLLFPLLLLITASTLYLQHHLKDTNKYQETFRQINKVCMVGLICLEIAVLPGFLMAIQNLVDLKAPQIIVISYINLISAALFILIDRQRRLYKGYSILIVLVPLVLSFDFGPMVMIALSYRLGIKEGSLYKRVIYFEMGIWSIFILAALLSQAQLNSFQLLTSLIAAVGITILTPQYTLSEGILEENEKLMRLVERMKDGRELTLKEKIQVSNAIYSFKQALKSAQKQHLAEKELVWNSKDCPWVAHRQEITEFISTKIAFELRRQYSHSLRIQQLQCQIRLSHITMRTLYDLQNLILQLRTGSAFQQRQRLHELVSLVDQCFLNKEENLHASATMTRQRQIERLYEIFINIAVVMQEFWTLHKGGRLNSRLIECVLRNVQTMENEAKNILWQVGSQGSTRHQLVFFQYLRKLVNNSVKPIEWRQSEHQKEDALGGDSKNYILIEQGNILAMSNRLLNEFQLSRKEAKGYRLVDIVNEQAAQFLSERLDRLIQEQDQKGQGSFLLPLKVSRERPYIMPYRAQVEILPQLMNGIKYILHLQKPTELQRTPCFLYCGNTDSIIGITRSIVPYFNLSHDHYLFHDFTHEIFSADLQTVAQAAKKDNSDIICEFKAKRTSTKIDGKSQMTKVPVVLRTLKQYDVDGQTLILFNVIKREEMQRTQLTNLISDKIVFLDEERDSKDEDREGLEGKTFCRIANPYDSQIDEKVSKMDEFYRMSFLKGLLIVEAGLLILLLVVLIILPLKMATTSSVLMDNYRVRIVENDKSINTLQIFTKSSILYQLYTYPDQYLAVNPNYNIPTLIKEYSRKVSQDIESVLQSTVENQIKGVSQNLTPIYNILEDAKLSIATHNVTALIASWPTVDGITAAGRTQDISISNIDDFFQYVGLIAAGVTALLVLIAQCLSYKAEQVLQEILKLYERIDADHAQQFSLKYRLFAYQLYSSSYFRGVRADQYLRNYKDNQRLKDIDQVETLVYIEKNVGIDMQQEEVNEEVPEGGTKVGRRYFLAFIWREGYIILPLLFFIGFLQFFLYRINSFQSDFSSIVSHSVRLHQARGNISYNTAYFMTSTLQEVLPETQRVISDPPTQMYLTSELSTPLPDYFQGYLANITQALNANICKMNLNSNSLYVGMTCEEVLGGILQKGYSETNIFFIDLVNDYSFSNMSSLGQIYRPMAAYPVFLEVLYVRRSSNNLITSIENDFLARTESFIKLQIGDLETIVNMGWILLPILLGVLVRLYYDFSGKCATTLKSFFILPKEYLLDMRVTKVLRQQDILNKIEGLAF